MMMGMKFPARFRVKRRLISTCVIAMAFMGPLVGTANFARADQSELDHDGRWEGYGKTVYLDASVAPYYLLLGGLAILGVAVMFKDAKRSHKKD